MPLATEVKICRSCGSERLAQVFDLGLLSLSDFTGSPNALTDKAPLELVRCENCTLVQLRHTVDRDRLYQRYWYRSGTQESMVSALGDVVRDAREQVHLQEGDIVLDVGANDGTLLRQYPDTCVRIGIEPSETFDEPCDIAWYRAFWPLPWTFEGKAKVITSIACFYDTDDPNAFVEAIKENLAPDGVWINQMAYLPATLAMNNYGDFCHEHLTYWTCQAFEHLLARHDLGVQHIRFNTVNGGSVRFIVTHGRSSVTLGDDLGETPFRLLAKNAEDNKRRLLQLLRSAKRRGEKVIGYGASTKGNTYLQYWGLGPDLLPTIADRNPDKWGKHTPTGQRVISEEEMRGERTEWLLVLPWHFLDAFVERESALLATGTRMLVPFPDLRIVGGDDGSNQQAAA